MKKLIASFLIAGIMLSGIIGKSYAFLDKWFPAATYMLHEVSETTHGIIGPQPFAEQIVQTVAGTAEAEAVEESKATAKVIYVIDGDTLYVEDQSGRQMKIRLIGVDTPESVHPEKERNSEEGVEASAFTKSLIAEGTEIRYELDAQTTDKYGRTLAYVYFQLEGEEVMLNRVLLREGMAVQMTIAPNVAYADVFREDEAYARENRKGFWSGSAAET